MVSQATPGGVHTSLSKPVYDRKYPSLKRFSWVWRILATYSSFVLWASTVPWLIVKWLAPANLQDNLWDIESAFLNIATPIINLVQDTAYKAFSIFDSTVDWFINTSTRFYNTNLKGFEKNFDHLLHNVEHRVKLLKDNGLSGITQALSFDLGNYPSSVAASVQKPLVKAADNIGLKNL